MRRADFWTLLCPEFTLRYPPRITVRGHSVQGGGGTLRKAPLPSRMCPWSTRRHCGPLAFRRATEGSRVQRRVWGSQEGAREPFGVLSPFCPRRRAAALPTPCHGEHPPTREGHPRLQRRTAVSAEGIPTAEGKEKGAAWPAGQAVSYAEKNLWNFFKKTLDFIVSIC